MAKGTVEVGDTDIFCKIAFQILRLISSFSLLPSSSSSTSEDDWWLNFFQLQPTPIKRWSLHKYSLRCETVIWTTPRQHHQGHHYHHHPETTISFAKNLSTFTYKTLLHVFSSYDGRNHRINSYVVWTLITWSYLTTWDFRDGTADGMTVTQNCTLYFDDDVLYNYNYVLCFHLYQSHVSHSQLLLIVLFLFLYICICVFYIYLIV